MFAGNIPVFEYDVRLLAVSHPLHVFTGNLAQLLVSQTVFGRGIQRDMENRVGRSPIGLQEGIEAGHAPFVIHAAHGIERIKHPIPEEHLSLSPVDLLLIIADSSADGCSRPYIRNHPSACLVRFKISILNAFSSRVCCSNAAIWRGIETLEKWLLMALTT